MWASAPAGGMVTAGRVRGRKGCIMIQDSRRSTRPHATGCGIYLQCGDEASRGNDRVHVEVRQGRMPSPALDRDLEGAHMGHNR